MVYRYKNRTIHARYGTVVVTHGEYAGRIGYYDDDEALDNRAIVLLYKANFELDRKRIYYFKYSHIMRIEVNERGYENIRPPHDDRSYGWDRYSPICQLCETDVGKACLLYDDVRTDYAGVKHGLWVCESCKNLADDAFWKLYRKSQMRLS